MEMATLFRALYSDCEQRRNTAIACARHTNGKWFKMWIMSLAQNWNDVILSIGDEMKEKKKEKQHQVYPLLVNESVKK